MEFDLESFLQLKRKMLETALQKLLSSDGADDHLQLRRAMSYAVLDGGKRLRPCLAMAACEAMGAKAEDALIASCAIEMVHAYSLVHDDLPAMDNDELRRGRPTVHKAFGETTAILAGDALLTFAFETIAAQPVTARGAQQSLNIIFELSRAAGWRGMVGGQALDMELKGHPPDFDTLELCHMGKTAALFAASAVIGGLCGRARETDLELLRGYGFDLGLAFQHADDLKDRENNDHSARAQRRAQELARRCNRLAQKLGPRGAPLVAFAELIEERARKASADEVSVAN